MDLATGAKAVRVLMQHNTAKGEPRLRRHCRYPLTAPRAVSRVYTDLAVLDVTATGFLVREIIAGLDLAGLQQRTEARLTAAADLRVLAVS